MREFRGRGIRTPGLSFPVGVEPPVLPQQGRRRVSLPAVVSKTDFLREKGKPPILRIWNAMHSVALSQFRILENGAFYRDHPLLVYRAFPVV
jgi:hypothetical protein